MGSFQRNATNGDIRYKPYDGRIGRENHATFYRSESHHFPRGGRENAFTAKELFAYVDRVIFENFDTRKAVTTYKQGIQACFISDFARTMAQNNISFGLGNESAGVLHAYFVELARKVKELSETHQDSLTRENYRVMLMRMNREYFDKQ